MDERTYLETVRSSCCETGQVVLLAIGQLKVYFRNRIFFSVKKRDLPEPEGR